MYYYSQKPLDPRLPKPLLHWDKNMTEIHYNAYVNAMREKQKQSQKKFHYDLAEDFEQKAKINEVNENSSEENNYPSIVDDEVQDHDSTNLANQKNTKDKDSSGHSFNFIAKPQPQMSNYNPNNKPQNTYQHFGYSQPPANQFLNQKFSFSLKLILC